MIERFTENQCDFIRKCADAVHSVEDGTVNQRTLNGLFYMPYFFTAPEDDWEENMRGAEEAKKNNANGNYYELAEMVSDKFPEVNKAYIPFLIGDILREAYEVRDDV